jgi:hypothetical protein
MSVTNPWTRHYQTGWENRAANHKLPVWMRLVCYAYGRHEANGHANFEAGALSWLLGTPPQDGEPFKQLSSQSVCNAINLAVKHEWLTGGSCTECLVVPSHCIEGPLGNPNKPCPVHEQRRQRRTTQSTTAPRLTLVSNA